MSGSSARPMRSVVSAWAPVTSDINNAAATTAKRKIFIGLIPLTSLGRRWRSPDYINPGRAGYFRDAAESGHQSFQRRREGAVRRNDGVRRRQLCRAVTRGRMSGCIAEQLRRLAAATLDHIGAARMKAAA